MKKLMFQRPLWCMLLALLLLPACSMSSAAGTTTSSRDDKANPGAAAAAYHVFEHRATNATLSFVQDSGICETTPGVTTYSGYLSVGTNMSMWFWFFEARANAAAAPLAMWLNGGPGRSSMRGLFQENGPCRIAGSSGEPELNPYSWNNYANMLYVDQPIGIGFSYGDNEVTSTVTAAPFVWNFMQAFFEAFPAYESREFGLWTESYGGHYAPEFAEYFEAQNKAISSGTITGETVNLVAVGINNGWIDPAIHYQAYVDFGYNNSWRQLINDTQYPQLQEAFDTKCAPLMAQCPGETGDDQACYDADNGCYEDVEAVVEAGWPDYPEFDAYDIREPSENPYPPETFILYLRRTDIMNAIGAQVTFRDVDRALQKKILKTGDQGRSFLGSLSTVVQSGVNVLIWAGDADWICNYLGNERVANEVVYNQSAEFKAASLEEYTLNGTSYGQFKTVGNLNYLKVYAAGHEVPYYQPEISLQAFIQIMQKKPLAST